MQRVARDSKNVNVLAIQDPNPNLFCTLKHPRGALELP